MNVTCSATPCPVILNATCVFYEGANLLYTGINTNDNLQTALQKIDATFQDAAIGYGFTNGLIQSAPGQPVMLGGALIQNTLIGGAYSLTFSGDLGAAKFITAGGTSSQFVKGNGSLDSTTYVPSSRTLTINGVTYDLSANRSWTLSTGTVTSVGAIAGTGISVGVSNPTTTPVITIVNTAPDRLVSLLSGAGIVVTGVYPNFTITNTSPSSGGTVTTVSASSPLSSTGGTTPNISITQASGSTNGYLSSTNWNTFNNKQNTIFLTTVGSSGVATLVGATINIPNYGLALSGYVPTSRTINTTSPLLGGGNLSANRTLSIALATASSNGYLSSTDWTIFNGKQPQLNGIGFVKASGTTISYDNSTYLTTISGIAAGGELSGTYANPSLVNSAVIGKVLTGLNVIGGSVVATDSILTAFGKVQNQINGLVGGLVYQGAWDASTNTPTLTSGVGTEGYFYITSVAGTTNLDGNADWHIGDWAVFNGSVWQLIDNTDSVTSVNGYIGAVNLTTADIPEVTNLYYTDTRARNALSAGTGISYASLTGIITNSLPDQTVSLSNGTGISVTGTYPNFTITNTSPSSGGTVTGTGTTNTLPKFTSASSIGDSNVKDDGNVVTINATAGSFGALQVGNYNGNILMNTNSSSAALIFQNTASSNKLWDFSTPGNDFAIDESSIPGAPPRMYFVAGGHILVNATLDDPTGGQFQVTGAIQQSAVTSSMLKASSVGVISAASAGVDYQDPITLTTTGTSGAATFIANTLNIPDYSGGGGGGIMILGSGICSTLRCGVTNVASCNYSSALSGCCNNALNYFSTIAGGVQNYATGGTTFIGGGCGNQAIGSLSTIGGGIGNIASGQNSTISGGYQNDAGGNYSFIGGGKANTASGYGSNISGGILNNIISQRGFIGGGASNTITFSSNQSVISGGQNNTVSNYYATISGGTYNAASGLRSNISGGANNATSGTYSTVGGGKSNTSSNYYTTISGGEGNTVTGISSTIGGGRQNSTTSGVYSTISGGHINSICSNFSAILGGQCNTISGFYDNVMILGSCITATQVCTTFVNDLSICSFNTCSGCSVCIGANGVLTATTGGGGGGSIMIVGFGMGSTIRCGNFNGAMGACATVSGGYGNNAQQVYSVIGGGRGNTASGSSSTISGGYFNNTMFPFSTVSGGLFNNATNSSATISGGYMNAASGFCSTIGGGGRNTASASCSTISGGYCNTVSGIYNDNSFIGGGCFNTINSNSCFSGILGGRANATCSFNDVMLLGSNLLASQACTTFVNDLSVCSFNACSGCSVCIGTNGVLVAASGGGGGSIMIAGTGVDSTIRCGVGNTASGNNSGSLSGYNNAANGQLSIISGGFSNTTSGFYSTVSGGCANWAANNLAFIGGGRQNTAFSNSDIVVGGTFNTTSGGYSFVGGGNSNLANGPYSTISSGYRNTASGVYSFIGGGTLHTPSGCASTISGGKANIAMGNMSTISGGYCNVVSATYSAIGGGEHNTASGQYSFIGGGKYNDTCTYSDVQILGSNICASQACTTFVNDLSVCSFNACSGCSVCIGTNGVLVATAGGGGGSAIMVVGGGLCSTIRDCNFNTSLGACGTVSGGYRNNVNQQFATISGGQCNNANGGHSTISGGYFNATNFAYSTVGGGAKNNACNGCSTVSGGYFNTASGLASFIGGGGGFMLGNTASGNYSVAVGGTVNTASGVFSTIGGGQCNTANACYSTIGGGQSNTTSGYCSSIIGGRYNTSSGYYSVIGGGTFNAATGNLASVFSGKQNTASCYYSFVGAGQMNNASDCHSIIVGGFGNNNSSCYSSILGGYVNCTCNFDHVNIIGSSICATQACTTFVNDLSICSFNTCSGCSVCIGTNGVLTATAGGGGGGSIIVLDSGACSTVRCGVSNCASGGYSAALGGQSNTASAPCATISGGYFNTACGYSSTISGGQQNTACNFGATIGGGGCNTASGNYSTVSGGCINSANGYSSTISGGYFNTACGNFSFVGGGWRNTASGFYSTVSGGYQNTANGSYSFVGGGYHNTASGFSSTASGYYAIASGQHSVVAGGYRGTSSGYWSTVSGGYINTASADYSVVGGGNCNCALARQSTISGGNNNTIFNFNIVGGSSIGDVIGGGGFNTTGSSYNSCYNTISGGCLNSVSGGDYRGYNTISGGRGNQVLGTEVCYATIGGGQANSISAYGYSSVIGGGAGNTISAYSCCSIIGGGHSNTISTYSGFAGILGGQNNTLSIANDHSFIVGSGLTSSASCTTYTNALSKTSGTFRINHPDPSKTATKYLQHSFVESPTRGDNIYRYVVCAVGCAASLELPSYYKFLNENDQVWVTPKSHLGYGFGVVNEGQTNVDITTNTDGEYNVLIIGTRKDIDAMNGFTGVEQYK